MLLFAGPKGGPLRRSNFQKHWRKALEMAGVPSVHFHDLRHTGNTLTAHSCATLSDLMLRMGHASTRAARIYLHTTSARDRAVTDSLALLVEAQRRKPRKGPVRNHRARDGHGACSVPLKRLMPKCRVIFLIWAFVVGAGDGIEPALSAWESYETCRRQGFRPGQSGPEVAWSDPGCPQPLAP